MFLCFQSNCVNIKDCALKMFIWILEKKVMVIEVGEKDDDRVQTKGPSSEIYKWKMHLFPVTVD